MSLFNRTHEDLAAFAQFSESVNGVVERLTGLAGEKDLQAIQKVNENFLLKTADFFRENRKLNIGVVGQVKAGKSSFLNTLLFGGAEVLPKASTPKTATLTKMEYADQNRMYIEYYSPDEWESFVDNAAVDEDGEVYQTAREIVGMVQRSGINPHSCLEQEFEERSFDTYEDLMANLNEYVGENGRFTPLVKAVTLYLNRDEFKNISIVDTPGLNDPIISRTIRTKEFMEVCDVVFFLSQSGSFLDKSDWTLLSSQLPQKGVKRLALIASKYDSGIRDVLRHKEEDDLFGDWDEDDNSADNIPAACRIVSDKLRRRARDKVAEFTKDLQRRGGSAELISVIEQCKEPLLVSVLCHNMANKPSEHYTAEERNVHRALSEFSADLEADLRLLGNLDRVRALFDAAVVEKDDILSQKAGSFVPTVREEAKQLLGEHREKAEKRLALLSGHDREQLLAQKLRMEAQIASIEADVAVAFGELQAKLESEKSEAVRELRQASAEYAQITDRSGREVKTGSRTYSTSKLLKPWTWGSSRTEHYTYTVSYSYLDVSDAVDNLRSFAAEAVNRIEEVFSEAVQIKELKRKLLNVIVNNFDMGNEKHDSSFFRLLVEERVTGIEYPVFKLDLSESNKQLTSTFTGEIRSASQKADLRSALTNTVSRIFDNISDQLIRTVKSYKEGLDGIGGQLTDQLLESIRHEFDELLAQFDSREQEIDKQRDYIHQLTGELKRLG